MFNTSLFNTGVFNSLNQIFDAVSLQDDIVFNGFSLQNANIVTNKRNIEDLPSIDFNTFKIPNENGEGIVSRYYRAKTIKIRGSLRTNTSAELEALIDTMKKALRKVSGNLDIKINGKIRRYIATLVRGNSIFNREKYNITFLPFELTFECVDPFGKEIDSEVNELFSQNSQTITQEVEHLGNVEAKPSINVYIQSQSNLTSLIIENLTTSERMAINRAFADNDVIQINSEDKTVKVNGVLVDYSGVFLKLEPDTNSIQFAFVCDSVVYNLSIKHQKTYS